MFCCTIGLHQGDEQGCVIAAGFTSRGVPWFSLITANLSFYSCLSITHQFIVASWSFARDNNFPKHKNIRYYNQNDILEGLKYCFTVQICLFLKRD